jgi:plasmid stability protein
MANKPEKMFNLIALRPDVYHRLKVFCATNDRSIIATASEFIDDGIARWSGPDYRYVAADSDHIAMPNES